MVRWVLEDVKKLDSIMLWQNISDVDIVVKDLSSEFRDVVVVSDGSEYSFEKYFEDMAVVAAVVERDTAYVLAVHHHLKIVTVYLFTFKIAGERAEVKKAVALEVGSSGGERGRR